MNHNITTIWYEHKLWYSYVFEIKFISKAISIKFRIIDSVMTFTYSLFFFMISLVNSEIVVWNHRKIIQNDRFVIVT